MRTLAIIGTLALVSAPVLAQKVAVPSGANGAAGTALHSAGNAAAAVPAAHEIGAQVVGPTVPAAQPFAAGVTAGTGNIASGISKTGDNVKAGGVTVFPTNSVGGRHQANQVKAAQRTLDQAKKAVPGQDEVQCDAQELAMGECQ